MEIKDLPIEQLFKSETINNTVKVPFQEINYIANAIIGVLHNLQ